MLCLAIVAVALETTFSYRAVSSSSSTSGGARPKAVSEASSSVAVDIEALPASDPYRFSGPQWHQAFPYPGLPPVTGPFGFHPWHLTQAGLESSVKAYLWSADQSSLIKVEQDLAKLQS